MMFSLGPETPEERAAADKARLEHRNQVERRYHQMLPHLKNAQRELRDAASQGGGGKRFDETRNNLAMLIDDIETILVQPVA